MLFSQGFQKLIGPAFLARDIPRYKFENPPSLSFGRCEIQAPTYNAKMMREKFLRRAGFRRYVSHEFALDFLRDSALAFAPYWIQIHHPKPPSRNTAAVRGRDQPRRLMAPARHEHRASPGARHLL
jgi:hypothetical protein